MAGYMPGEQPQENGIIKLNTNENPYPPSPRVKEALLAAVSDRMEFRERQAGRFLYVPVDPSTRDSRPGICDEAACSR